MIKKQLFLVLLLGILVRVFGILILDLGEWDERYHANVAKNFIENPLTPLLINDNIIDLDNTDWSQTDIWLAKPPIALWTSALGIYIFGPNEFGLRIFSLIFSVLSLWLVYNVGKTLYNHTVGILSTFFYAINGLLYRINIGDLSGDHIDTLLHLLILLIVYYIIKKRQTQSSLSPYFIGVLLGVSFLVKWTMIFVVVPFLLISILLSSNFNFKFFFLIFFWFLCISLPWVFWIYYKFPIETIEMFKGLIYPVNHVIHGHEGDWYYYLDKIRIYINELIYFPLFFIIYFFIKKRTYNRTILVLWIIIPLVLLSIAETKREVYLCIFAAPVFISQSLFIVYLWKNLRKFNYKIINYLIISSIFILAIRFSIERIKFDRPRLSKPEYREKFELNLKNKFFLDISKTIIINEPKYLEIRYYYGIKAYRYLDDSLVQQINAKGFEIYENKNGSYVKM